MSSTANSTTPSSGSITKVIIPNHVVPTTEPPREQSPLETLEIVRIVLTFVGRGHYRFAAILNRQFKDAYTQLFPSDTKTQLRLSTLELAKISYEESVEHRPVLCRCAARYGNLEVLQYLHSMGCQWDSSTCHNAAKYGHLHILIYAHQHQFPWGRHTVYFAAIHGHLHILLWSQMVGIPWEDDHIICGAMRMNKKNNLIDFLHQQMNLE